MNIEAYARLRLYISDEIQHVETVIVPGGYSVDGDMQHVKQIEEGQRRTYLFLWENEKYTFQAPSVGSVYVSQEGLSFCHLTQLGGVTRENGFSEIWLTVFDRGFFRTKTSSGRIFNVAFDFIDWFDRPHFRRHGT